MTSLQKRLSVDMGSVFIVTCCTESHNQPQAVAGHTQVPVGTLPDQLKPDAAAAAGVLVIP